MISLLYKTIRIYIMLREIKQELEQISDLELNCILLLFKNFNILTAENWNDIWLREKLLHLIEMH